MMTATARNIRITDGTSQDDRFPIALQAGYVDIDERSHEELLATGVEYASLLNYYALNNRPDTGWHTFFAADAAIIMAMIQTTDLAKIESHFRNVFLRNAAHQSYKLSAVPNWALAKRINRWFRALKAIESESGRQLVQKIAGLIEAELGRALGALVDFLTQYNVPVSDIVQRDFDRLWLHAPPDQPQPPVPAPADGNDAIHRFFKSNFYVFYNAVRVLIESSRSLFPEALQSRAHDPAVGLYIAFAKLFENVQHKVNQFTRQHLDFYYHEVLKIQPRRIVPDSTYLIFRPDVAERRVHIPRGTAFSAGVDDNNAEVIYTADNDLTVTGTAVAALATLFFERDPLISPERELAFSSGARANRIPVSTDNGAGNGEPPAFPTFGAPKSGSEAIPHQEADFGFALASPVLLLKEGRRDITVTLQTEFAPGSDIAGITDFVKRLKRIIKKSEPAAALPAEIAQDGAGQDPFELDAFFKAFRHMFAIHLSTETGWHEVSEYLPLSQVVDQKQYRKNSLSFQFCLPPEVAAVVPYSPQIHGGQFETDLPVMRFMINPEAYIYPYSLLKQMVVNEIEIQVAVNGVREVLLYNNLGRLDPNAPFNPFGPAPAVGSYFIAGNFEAARKQLTRFEMEVEWGDLPQQPGGFQEYYQAYGMPFDNASFAVHLAALNGGRWLPAVEQKRPRVPLFASGAAAGNGAPRGRIPKERRISCRAVIPFCKPVEVPAADTEFGYSTLAKNGFFKFTLSDPAFAFGHADYPERLAKVLTANARLSRFRLSKPLPNPPYTPLINRISINYRAAARIDLAQFNPAAALAEEKLFHIHPFGIEAVSPASHRSIRLLPPYDSDGNLFIGLSAGAVGGDITLFFHLREDSSAAAHGDPSDFSWHYLSSNKWKRLEPDRVISDTTEGFRTSGIVTLDLPQDVNPDNSILPGGLFWLRVSLDKHPAAPCSLYAVNTHALKVSWQPGEQSLAHLQTRLPAGTIKEARTSIAGISQIKQIVDSFGGRLPESPFQLKRRVSERLKHKNRATTAWDYERLILERFPEILKVKCFDNMVADPQNFIRPGHILIVVIPQLKKQSPPGLQPMVNSGLLAQIRAFVAQIASPFARIEVRNPAYERIQIRCTVKLRRGIDPGYAINALNQALNAYLSPWHKTGYHARFGWRVRRYDLESYIQHLDYIEYVEKFSMLRIVEHQRADAQIADEGPFELLDTVPVVHAVVISGDGRRLVTAGADATARLWDLSAPDPAASQMVLRGHHGDVLAAAFSPDGLLLVTTGSDKTSRIWDLSAADPREARWVLTGHAGAVLSAAVSQDGHRLATTGSDHSVCIWDLAAGDPARTRQLLQGHTGAVLTAVFSADSRRLVTTASDGTARIWDLTARDPSRSPAVLSGHRDEVTAAAVSPDGRRLVTTSRDNSVRIWDLSAQNPSQTQRVLRGHAGTVLAVAFSADGSRLATAGSDNTARLWDLKNADRDEALQVFEGHDDALLAVTISPDSRRLATVSADNTARLWDLAADGRAQMPQTLRLPADAGSAPAGAGNVPWVLAAAVSPDSRRLATVSSDNSVRLWNLTAGDPAASSVIDLGSADEEIREIRPACPWSIATPVRRHFIRATDGIAPKPPQKTGVDELEIGNTFIITGK